MPRWLRRTLVVIGILLVIGAGAYYWFFFDSRAPGNLPTFALDMAKVRAVASEPPGEKATEVRVETVALISFPKTAVVAGESWAGLPMGVFSYQLVFPHQTIIVDTGFDEAGAKSLGGTLLAPAYASMQAGMLRAAQIVITHEHPDHIGGILSYPDPTALIPKLSLTVEQIANAGKYTGFSLLPAVLAEAKPIAYDDYYAMAPGIVLIKAPGHSPGSQMVYVQRADGREYLFAGDIGWSLRNIEEIRGKARLVTQFLLHEDREAVFSELAALNALQKAEPNLIIVPGHDLEFVQQQVAAGNLVQGFAEQAR